MSKPIIRTCPYGHTCKTETATEIHMCHHLIQRRVEVDGVVKEIEECAHAANTALQYETARQTHILGLEIAKLRKDVTDSEMIATNTAARMIGAGAAIKQIEDNQPQIQKV